MVFLFRERSGGRPRFPTPSRASDVRDPPGVLPVSASDAQARGVASGRTASYGAGVSRKRWGRGASRLERRRVERPVVLVQPLQRLREPVLRHGKARFGHLDVPPSEVVDVLAPPHEVEHLPRLGLHRRRERREVDARRELRAGEGRHLRIVDPKVVAPPRVEARDGEGLPIERGHEVGAADHEPDQGIAEIQRKGQRLVPLGPCEPFPFRADLGDLRVQARRPLRGGVEDDRRHEGRRVPGLQERLGHREVARGTGMDAVGNDLRRVRGIRRVRPGEHRDDRAVQVGHGGVDGVRLLPHEVGVAQQDRVVAARKARGAGHVVVGRGLDQGQPRAGRMGLEAREDMLIARPVGVEQTLVERAVARVVHAEHDRHDRGPIGEDVAGEADVDRAAPASAHPVAAPSGVDELDLEVRVAGSHVGLDVKGVEPLVGDAVAVEHDSIAVAEGEGRALGGSEGGEGGEGKEERELHRGSLDCSPGGRPAGDGRVR